MNFDASFGVEIWAKVIGMQYWDVNYSIWNLKYFLQTFVSPRWHAIRNWIKFLLKIHVLMPIILHKKKQAVGHGYSWSQLKIPTYNFNLFLFPSAIFWKGLSSVLASPLYINLRLSPCLVLKEIFSSLFSLSVALILIKHRAIQWLTFQVLLFI